MLKYIIESDKMNNKKIVFIISGVIFIIIISILIFILVKNNSKKNDNDIVYTITLVNEEEVKEIKGKKDEKINLPVLSRDGSSFLGWVDKDDKVYNGEYVIKDNINLVSKFKENNSYSIIFIVDPFKDMIVKYVNYNEKIDYPETVRDGYVFEYWVDDDGNTFNYDKYPYEKNIMLTAVWSIKEPEQYIIKFNTNGGNKISDQIVIENNKIIKPSDPKKNGFCFKGWEYNNTIYNFDNIVNKNMTLKAKYEELFGLNESTFDLIKLNYNELSKKYGIKKSNIKKGKVVSTNKGNGYYSEGLVIYNNGYYAYFNFFTFSNNNYSNNLNKQTAHYIGVPVNDLFNNYNRNYVSINNLKCLGYTNVKYNKDNNIYKFDYGKYSMEIYNFNTNKEKAYIWNIK